MYLKLLSYVRFTVLSIQQINEEREGEGEDKLSMNVAYIYLN